MFKNTGFLVLIILALTGCSASRFSIPSQLDGFDVSSDCPDSAGVIGIEIKAFLSEDTADTWLAVYWVPTFHTREEPYFELTSGIATYMGKADDVYYYIVTNLPRNNDLGKLILPSHTDNHHATGEIIEMRRSLDSNCIELNKITHFDSFKPSHRSPTNVPL